VPSKAARTRPHWSGEQVVARPLRPEKEMEDRYVCPCGLTCCDCLFYNREFFDAARMMKKLIDQYRFDAFFGMMSKPEASAHIAAHLNRRVRGCFHCFQ
jgi:hypothetical protein